MGGSAPTQSNPWTPNAKLVAAAIVAGGLILVAIAAWIILPSGEAAPLAESDSPVADAAPAPRPARPANNRNTPRPAAARPAPAPAPKPTISQVPPLEVARAAAEEVAGANAQEGTSKLSADFECAFAPNAKKISDTHFVLDFENKYEWMFLFRLTGVAGKTIRIDCKNVPLAKWATLNPVYQYMTEHSELPGFPGSEKKLNAVKSSKAPNGAILPNTSEEKWHFIPETWANGSSTFSFVETFAEDNVTVAMKTPFTLNDEKMLLEEVKREPAAQMIEVGMTESGRPLTVIKVSTGGDAGERLHPTVVMYAREHADEHDTSWVVTGALRQVLSGDAAGKELRNNYNFFFIPILDLDAAARCQHETIIETFRPERPTSESKALCNFFRSWVNAGKRIDVVLNIHNLESAEGGHLSWACATDPRTFGIARSLNDSFRTELRTLGFNVPAEPGRRQELPFRFASWLSNTYGALHLPYEANSQEPTRHLTCGELQLMGGVMARRFSNFFPTSEGKNLLASVNESRQGYAARWREYGSGIQDLDALAAEQKCLWKARSEETLSQFESGKLNLDTISRQH